MVSVSHSTGESGTLKRLWVRTGQQIVQLVDRLSTLLEIEGVEPTTNATAG